MCMGIRKKKKKYFESPCSAAIFYNETILLRIFNTHRWKQMCVFTNAGSNG